MNKVTSYLKNVGKSISYSTVDVVSEKLIPEVSEFKSTNKELFKSIYATVTHSKQSLNYAKKMTKQSQIYKDINAGINNALDDIKSGNFYNKKRADDSIDSATSEMLGLDDFDDWNMDDGSLDDFQDESPSVDKGSMVIADTVNKSSNLSAQLISKTVANTSNNIIKANVATANVTMAHNMELVAGIRTSIAGVHESINSLLKFAQHNVPVQINNQSQYFTDSMAVMKENNAILKEMLEMQRNVYKQQREEYNSKDQFSNVFAGGSLDISEYFKAVTKNIKNLDNTGTVGSMFSEMGGTTMLGQIMANPLGAIMTGLIKSYIPKDLAKQIASFSKTLGGIFPTMIARLNKWRDDDKGGVLGLLGKIFGLKSDTKNSIDTSKYNKGAVPFDGITRKSIIEVIPGYLSKIESILSGSSQRIFDYDSGKWITSKDIKKKQKEEEQRYVKDSFTDISGDIKKYISELEKQRALDAETKKSFEKDIYKMMKNGFNTGYFSPEDVKKNIYEYSNTELMESLMEVLSKVPVSKLLGVSSKINSNKSRRGRDMADKEASGHSIFQQLYNDSGNDSHLKFHDKYKDQVIGNKSSVNLLNIKDHTGNNTLDYLRQILENVSYIREFGGSGNRGKRKGKNKKSESFENYKKRFNTPYIPGNIQKLNKEEANRNEYFNKDKYDPNVNMDDAILAAEYATEKDAMFSDLDEDDFKGYGKRYKESNKWQDEMKKIPGDTFVEKWHQANSMRQKQVLIMGSLSDIAKKPATLLTGMIATAENSIYNFLFKAETDELDDTGKKIEGFFPAMLNQMRSKWDTLTTSIDEKLITPLVEKYGLDEKWDEFKQKIANSKPGQVVKDAKDKLMDSLKSDVKSIFKYTKDSIRDVASPIIDDPTVADYRINSNNKRKEKAQANIVQKALNGNAKNNKDYTKGIKLDLSEADINKDNTINAGGTIRLTEDGWVYGHKGEAIVPADQVDKASNAKAISDIIKKSNSKVISNDYHRDSISLINDYVREITNAPNGIIANLKEYAPLSKNIADKYNSKNSNINSRRRESGIVTPLINELENAGNAIKTYTKTVIGIKGDTPEEQKAEAEKEKNKLLIKSVDIFREMKGEGASTASKAIIGGGLGLLSGVVGGPLLGAGIGIASSFIKNSTTVNKLLFGEEITDEEGNIIEEKDGLISKKIQDTFKKYVPDMGKFGVAGGVASFLLPFGPLAGAAIGAGIGLAKNSDTMQEMIFGEEGLINKNRKEKIKKYLPKAAIGAASGLFLGPFGILGNAALGAGVGMLTGTEDFKDLILGKKDNNGDRIGGVKGALQEHFIDPIKNFGRNFKDDFFGFIKENMIDPLNEAITPITNEIAFQTKRVVFGIPKWFLNLGKDYIAVPLLNKINDKLIDPITDKVKSLFKGVLTTVKGVISAPFRAVGKIGEQTRKHQIRQGRDVVGTAKDRIKFAADKKMKSYKYESFDKTLAEKSEEGDTEWLEELTARTGMLAHGSDYFDKEVKKARNELSRVVSDYYKLGWFSKDKKSYNRIRKYIHNNDIESAITELTNIKESRTTGGPLGKEAGDAVARFTRANKKYQVARDNRDKFGNINKEENAAWMQKNFGSNWSSMRADRLFDYARKESANGKVVNKEDLFKDPTALVTKGEAEINKTLNKILKILAGDKYTFQDEDKNEEYDNKAKAASNEVDNILNQRKNALKDELKRNSITTSDTSVDLLYANTDVYDLVIAAGKKGVSYDDATIAKLCKLKLTKNDVKLLKKFPYVGTLPEEQIKKNLNYLRNDKASISILNAKKIRNNNLGILNLAGKLNTELDESSLLDGKVVDKDDKNGKYMYQNSNHGIRRYIKDQKGKWTVDLSDSDTKISLQKEKEEEEKKNTFFGTFSGIKDGIFNIFKRDKDKEEKEKKEPWYKKLFNADLGEFGTKIKFGAAILGGLSFLGAISNLWENKTEGGVVDTIGTTIKDAVTPAFTKIGNWFMNEGEYAAEDKGFSGFLNNHVFPNLFSGMNVFFGKIMPAVIKAFVVNIPTMVKAVFSGLGELLGWTDNSRKNDATVSAASAKTVSSNASSSSKGSIGASAQWINKLASDSATTANNIYSETASVDNKGAAGTTGSTGSGNKTKSGGSSGGGIISRLLGLGKNTGSSINNTGLYNANLNETGVGGGDVAISDDDYITFDGIGIAYKLNEKGNLEPITVGEYKSGAITEFYNENGNGHWVYNPDIQSFEADSGASKNKLPSILAYATAKSFFTGRTPAIFKAGPMKVLGGINKAMSHVPFYKKASLPIKGIGKGFDWLTKKSASIGKSFSLSNAVKTELDKSAQKSAKNTVKVSGKRKVESGIAKKGLDVFATKTTKDTAKSAAKNTANEVIEEGAKSARKNAAKSTGDAYKSGLVKRITNWISGHLSKLLNHSKVYKYITKGIAECGTKKSGKTIVKTIIDKFMSTAAKQIVKRAPKIAAKIAAYGTVVVEIAWMVADFLVGVDKAEAILGISEPTIVQTLIAGLVNVISNDIFFGLIPSATIVTWMTNIIFPLFDINLEKFKEERAKEDEKTKEYNLKNGEDLTTEERLSRQKSISGKIGYGIKKGASVVKNGVSNAVSWLGENGSRVGSFITDTGSNLISHGKKTIGNIGKNAKNAANNVLGNVTDDDKIRKRFGLNDNVKVTLRDRAISGAGYAVSKLTGGDADTTAKVLNGQLLTVQKYAGKAGKAYDNYLGKIMGFTDDDGNPISLSEGVGRFGKTAKGVGKSIARGARKTGKRIRKGAINTWNDISDTVGNMRDSIGEGFGNLKEGAGKTVSKLNDELGSLLGATDDKGNPVSLTKYAKMNLDKRRKMYSAMWKLTKEYTSEKWNDIKESAGKGFNKFVDNFGDGLERVNEQIGAIMGLEDENGDPVSLTKAISINASNIMNNLRGTWKNFRTGVGNFFGSLGSGIVDFFTNKSDEYADQRNEDAGSGTHRRGIRSSFITSGKSKSPKLTAADVISTHRTNSSNRKGNKYAGRGNIFTEMATTASKYYDEKVLELFGLDPTKTSTTSINISNLNTNLTTTASTTSSTTSSAGYNGPVSGKASDVVRVAKGELGNGGSKYQAKAGIGNAAWCVAFVYWCCCKAGCKKAFGRVGFRVDVPMEYWRKKGREVKKTEGQPGDFVSFHNGRGMSHPYQHIGIIEKNLGNGKYRTIEGNYSNRVSNVTRTTSQIGRIVRPDYGAGSGTGDYHYINNSNMVSNMMAGMGIADPNVVNTGPDSPDAALLMNTAEIRKADTLATREANRLNNSITNNTTSISNTNSTGSGSGRGTSTNTGFVSQLDPKYRNKTFNTSKDTEHQTLGDSGCAPATAANILNIYSGRGTQFDQASKAALRYKDKNSGVTPDYFENYLGSNGIDTYSTTDRKELISSIQAGNPTILLGQNKSDSANTPYGTSSSHYVLATGMDGQGNVIVQNPESRTPNSLYPAKDLLNNSHLGMVTNKVSSGRGTAKRKYKNIKNKNEYFVTFAGQGHTSLEIEKKVWQGLRGAGYTEVQTAGVMGNIYAESGFNPAVVERGSGIGFGLCQWSYSRRTSIEKYAKKLKKSANNVDVQLSFLIAEMNPKGGAKGYAHYQFGTVTRDGKKWSGKVFKNAKDVETATKCFCYSWERPGVVRMDVRINAAKKYYKKYTGLDPASINLDGTDTEQQTETQDNSIFGALTKAALSYYDDKLLTLFGFNTSSSVQTTTADSTDTSSSESNARNDYSEGSFTWPLPHTTNVTSDYGYRIHPVTGGRKFHSGIDIASGGVYGKKIVAAAPGKVVFAGTDNSGYGKHVIIRHGSKLFTLYGHCSSLSVKKGDNVIAGEKIAAVGSTGMSTGPHLHFEVRKGSNNPSNRTSPWKYLKKKKSGKGSGKGTGLAKTAISLSGKGTERKTSKKASKSKVSSSVNYSPNKDGIFIAPATGYPLQKKGKIYIDPTTKKELYKEKDGDIVPINPKDPYTRLMSDESVSDINSTTNKISGSGTNRSSMILTNLKSSHFNKFSKSGASNSYNNKSLFTMPSLSGSGSKSKSASFSLPSLSKSLGYSNGYSYSSGYSSSVSGGNSSTERLLTVIIDVLGIIANNSAKLSEIVNLLSKSLDLNLSDNDISKLSSNNAQVKNKIAKALKSQGSTTGMGNSIMNANTESLTNAMYSIARA